jgi:hypothetical protein
MTNRARETCPPEQPEPAREAERHAQRVLVRRREDHRASSGCARDPHGDVEPMIVDWDRHRSRVRSDNRASRAEVTGILHPHVVGGIDDQPQDLVERLLRAGRDEDLLGAAAHAARGRDVRGDRLAQRALASRRRPFEQRRARTRVHARGDPRPQRDRKQIERRYTRPERTRRGARALRAGGHRRERPRDARQARRSGRRRPRLERPHARRGQLRCDERRGGRPRDNEAFRRERAKRLQHGGPGDAEITRELPGRRQANARR